MVSFQSERQNQQNTKFYSRFDSDLIQGCVSQSKIVKVYNLVWVWTDCGEQVKTNNLKQGLLDFLFFFFFISKIISVTISDLDDL